MWVSRETIAARTERVTAGELVSVRSALCGKNDKILRVPISVLCVGKTAEDNFLKRIFSLREVHLHHLRCCFIGHLKEIMTRNLKSEELL